MNTFRLIRRNLGRKKTRTLLTLGGLATAVALFVSVESLNAGLERALSGSEARKTLVVYRKNRYCPQTSNLPERYAEEIRDIVGVESVLPVKVFLNNCRTSLDMITFHGAPVDELLKTRKFDLVDGDLGKFQREPDAALVGKGFAGRRGLDVGDNFRFGNVNVKIAGIFTAADSTAEETILTHLEYLQRAGPVNRLGTVTQFEVKIDDPNDASAVARRIDAHFATAEEPTDTRPRLEFLETATRDLREILGFGRIFGFSCALVALALMGGTVVMSVQERFREFGVFRAIGYKARHLATLVLGETFLLAAAGAGIGVVLAIIAIESSDIAIGVEGVQIAFAMSPTLVARGFGLALACGFVAGILPAWRVAHLDVVRALRSL